MRLTPRVVAPRSRRGRLGGPALPVADHETPAGRAGHLREQLAAVLTRHSGVNHKAPGQVGVEVQGQLGVTPREGKNSCALRPAEGVAKNPVVVRPLKSRDLRAFRRVSRHGGKRRGLYWKCPGEPPHPCVRGGHFQYNLMNETVDRPSPMGIRSVREPATTRPRGDVAGSWAAQGPRTVTSGADARLQCLDSPPRPGREAARGQGFPPRRGRRPDTARPP